MKFIKIIFLIYLNFLNIYCKCPEEFSLYKKNYLSIYPAKEFDLIIHSNQSESFLLNNGIVRTFIGKLYYKDYDLILQKFGSNFTEIKDYNIDYKCYSLEKLKNITEDNLCNYTTDSSVYKMDTYCFLLLHIMDKKEGKLNNYIMYILFNKDLPAKEKIKIDIKLEEEQIKVDLTYSNVRKKPLYYILIIIPIIILIIIGIILYLKKDKIFKNSNSIY